MELPTGNNIVRIETKTPVKAQATVSPRESDVVALLYAGKNNASIATELNITEKTVKFHLGNVFKKTGTKSRTELMSMEIRRLQEIVLKV